MVISFTGPIVKLNRDQGAFFVRLIILFVENMSYFELSTMELNLQYEQAINFISSIGLE